MAKLWRLKDQNVLLMINNYAVMRSIKYKYVNACWHYDKVQNGIIETHQDECIFSYR